MWTSNKTTFLWNIEKYDILYSFSSLTQSPNRSYYPYGSLLFPTIYILVQKTNNLLWVRQVQSDSLSSMSVQSSPGWPVLAIIVFLTLAGCVSTMRCTGYVSIRQYRTPLYYMYTVVGLDACCIAGECNWLSVGDCHVGRLYTSLRRWKFWIVVWDNTNNVHFRAIWKNTAHVQGIRCLSNGSHLIPEWWVSYFPILNSNEHRNVCISSTNNYSM